MANSSRKLKRKKSGPAKIQKPAQEHGVWVSLKEAEQIKHEITLDASRIALLKVLAIASYVLQYHFKAIQKKDTRLENFYDLYCKNIELIAQPSDELLLVEQQLIEIMVREDKCDLRKLK